MNIALPLERTSARYPDRLALAQGDRELTYAQLGDRVRRIAAGLAARGLEAGDRVALLQHNRPELLETMLACWHGGLISVPVNARSSPFEVADVLADAGPRICIYSEGFEEHVEGLAPGVERIAVDGPAGNGTTIDELLAADPAEPAVGLDGSEPAWLFYSSGTTGRMKGATLSHRNLAFMTQAFLGELYKMEAEDVVLHAAPLTHGSGLYALPPIFCGASQLLTASRSFDPGEVLELVTGRGVTSIAFLAPTMVNRLVAEQEERNADTSSLRLCVYGGAPMYVEDVKSALKTFGPVFAQIYGQAECPVTISRLSPAEHAKALDHGDGERLGSAGVPYSGMEVRTDAEAGAEVGYGDGEVGEILVRGDAVMVGYWGDPEATAGTLDGGWLRTGDIGRLDESGFLFLVDRNKDVIISGAANIYPREVEEVLLNHPRVREVCVVGVPDAEWGERVVAVVGLDPASDRELVLDELSQLGRERLSGYKMPREFEFVDELPKSPYGKILKRTVRRRFWEGTGRQI